MKTFPPPLIGELKSLFLLGTCALVVPSHSTHGNMLEEKKMLLLIQCTSRERYVVQHTHQCLEIMNAHETISAYSPRLCK